MTFTGKFNGKCNTENRADQPSDALKEGDNPLRDVTNSTVWITKVTQAYGHST